MKIAFTNPSITREERYGELAAAGSDAPPLALCALAAVTRAAGHETIIIDAQVEKITNSEAVRRIEAFSPDVVGITSTTSTFLSATEQASLIKELNSDILVVAGGVHVSALPDESLERFKDVDIVVIGEGDDTISELMDVFEGNGTLGDVKGIAYREGEKIVLTETRPLIKDLDLLPQPAWDLLKDFPEAYSIQAQSVAKFPSSSICTSRGCSGKCTFCDRRIFGSRLRANSAEYVMEIIRDLYHNYGVRNIQFDDDNFMLFGKRLKRICKMIKDEKLDITWSCQARVDMANLEVYKMMKEAGCWAILYGVESGSQKILDFMKKNISLEKVDKAIDMVHKAGIYCKGFFITGFIGEDMESLEETRQYIKRCKLDDISNHYFTPFPGCEAYFIADKYGDFENDWRRMNFYEPVFVPYGLTREDLTRYIKLTYREFYIRPRTLFGYLKRLRSPRHFFYLMKSGFSLFRYVFKGGDK